MQDRSSHRARVLRYGGEAGARVDDQLAAEEPLEIRIGGQPLTLMMRTPGHDRDLALGFLYGEGIIRSADDVAALTVVPNGEHPDLENVIDVQDRKSTRLNSSHSSISYAVFCLKKKTDLMRLI